MATGIALSASASPDLTANYPAALREGFAEAHATLPGGRRVGADEVVLVVSVAEQALAVVRGGQVERVFPASTAKAGVGSRPNSAATIDASRCMPARMKKTDSFRFEEGRALSAAAGYLCACVVGVILLNILARRGSVKPQRKSRSPLPLRKRLIRRLSRKQRKLRRHRRKLRGKKQPRRENTRVRQVPLQVPQREPSDVK